MTSIAMNAFRFPTLLLILTLGALSACSHSGAEVSSVGSPEAALVGRVRWEGAPPKPRIIDVSSCPTCREANPHGVSSEAVLVDPAGNLANVVVYIDSDVGDGGNGAGASDWALFAMLLAPFLVLFSGLMWLTFGIDHSRELDEE